MPIFLEQFGGPDGELAAAMRYLTQGLAEIDPGRKDLLLDIATEELSHLEVVGSVVTMLNQGVKGQMAEGLEAAELLASISGGTDSHTGAALWRRRRPDQFGGRAVDRRLCRFPADFRSNIAAEARAKIIYERLINLCDDPGVKDALGFLMTREIAHQKSFEKALYVIETNFPPGQLPGQPEFTNAYFNMSQGDGDMRGPWNQGKQWDFV